MQLGVDQGNTVYAECQYEDCDAGLIDFHWWESRMGKSDYDPEVPDPDVVYPLYP